VNATQRNTGLFGPSVRKSAKASSPARLFSVLGILLAIAVGAWGYHTWSLKEVHIFVESDGPIILSTKVGSVEDALLSAGIDVFEGDEVSPPLDAPLRDGDEIRIARARHAHVNVDGARIRVALASGTVRDALVAADVRMGPLDRVQPVRETPFEDGMEITVIRVVQEEIEETEVIPFATLEWAEPHLPRGETRIVREGREGLLVRKVLLTYENGELAARKVISNEVAQEAVAKIIGIGTREAMNVIQTSTGSYRYSQMIELEATAYYPGPESTGEWADGYTYTGLRAGKGVVAVDPNVIELGTRLYIPEYGEAIAADIGGAIKGRRIDLGFDTIEEALKFGRKMITAYILAD